MCCFNGWAETRSKAWVRGKHLTWKAWVFKNGSSGDHVHKHTFNSLCVRELMKLFPRNIYAFCEIGHWSQGIRGRDFRKEWSFSIWGESEAETLLRPAKRSQRWLSWGWMWWISLSADERTALNSTGVEKFTWDWTALWVLPCGCRWSIWSWGCWQENNNGL